LAVELWPYEALAARVWELRQNLTSYDGAYVAFAEAIDVPLVTFDRRLARASGIRCIVRVPPASLRDS
jgi:predicted nucleic acid-binding protein